MTRERMIEVYGEKLNLLAESLEKYGKGEFKTFSDSADWSLEVYVSKHRLEGTTLDVLLGKVIGGYSTGNAFTEDIVEHRIYEIIGVKSLRDTLNDLIFNALKLAKCPVV